MYYSIRMCNSDSLSFSKVCTVCISHGEIHLEGKGLKSSLYDIAQPLPASSLPSTRLSGHPGIHICLAKQPRSSVASMILIR